MVQAKSNLKAIYYQSKFHNIEECNYTLNVAAIDYQSKFYDVEGYDYTC